MKMYIIAVLYLIIPGSASAQNNPLDIFNAESFYDETGTLLQDGDIVQIIWCGADSLPNPPNLNQNNFGRTTGDDSLLQIVRIGDGVPPSTGMFFKTITTYSQHQAGYPAAEDFIYTRVFNDSILSDATAYGESPVFKVTNTLGEMYLVQIPGNQTGTVLLNEVWDLKHADKEENVRVFPNPAFGKVHIYFDQNSKNARGDIQISIYDVLGRPVFKSTRISETLSAMHYVWEGKKLSGEKLPAGVYFIQIRHNLKFYHRRVILSQ